LRDRPSKTSQSGSPLRVSFAGAHQNETRWFSPSEPPHLVKECSQCGELDKGDYDDDDNNFYCLSCWEKFEKGERLAPHKPTPEEFLDTPRGEKEKRDWLSAPNLSADEGSSADEKPRDSFDRELEEAEADDDADKEEEEGVAAKEDSPDLPSSSSESGDSDSDSSLSSVSSDEGAKAKAPPKKKPNRRPAKAQVCGQCGEIRMGEVDPEDDMFYCDSCWKEFRGVEEPTPDTPLPSEKKMPDYPEPKIPETVKEEPEEKTNKAALAASRSQAKAKKEVKSGGKKGKPAKPGKIIKPSAISGKKSKREELAAKKAARRGKDAPKSRVAKAKAERNAKKPAKKKNVLQKKTFGPKPSPKKKKEKKGGWQVDWKAALPPMQQAKKPEKPKETKTELCQKCKKKPRVLRIEPCGHEFCRTCGDKDPCPKCKGPVFMVDDI